MKIIAGVDIGNSTTEVCIGNMKDNGNLEFLSSSLVPTTGAKGTIKNIKGIMNGLNEALQKVKMNINNLALIRINEAAPVIGDTAMETITETIITESTMIGHNPRTPGGEGFAKGITLYCKNINSAEKNKSYILVIPKEVDYTKAAEVINTLVKTNIHITGAIVQSDEGVLINNRLNKKIPIVDEVKYIEKVPENMISVVEVAPVGQSVKVLSNPFGIATAFDLNSEQTKYVVPIAKSLIGNRSAVVIKTPEGEVKEKIIPAGKIFIKDLGKVKEINIDAGAEEIMKAIENSKKIEDITGEPGTNVGGMLSSIKNTMADLTEQNFEAIKIKDLLAVDTMIPVKVQGGIAGETSMEKAVAIAAMVKTERLPMAKVAEALNRETGIYVEIAGVEAVMASLGAMTTPGTSLPLAILDLGGGSTDAAVIDEKGVVKSIHLAGAGELVTMIINSELGLNNKSIAEEIKKYPLAKIENLFQVRMENGDMKFFDRPLNPKLFGRIVVLKDNDMVPILKDISIEEIVQVRKAAKEKVFVSNALRALKIIAAMNNVRNIPSVVLVGGSAVDFEIPELIIQELSKYRIVSGRGNIRKMEGPRNAVATGLVMSYCS